MVVKSGLKIIKMEKVQHFHLAYHPINKKLVVIFNIGNIKYNMIIKLVFISKNPPKYTK